jgi:catechol 2,3-dioxygenase-like lactoylglutathione lyase family enzyme
MTPRLHIHLSVSDVDRSSAFYETLFGAPVKVKPGYRKFLPTFAPLNLALSHGLTQPGPRHVNHVGIQFETSAEVTAHLARLKAAGVTVREEMGVSCCHANQDKFWVRDPDGAEWEFYSINFDVDEPAVSAATGCCSTTGAQESRDGACGGG